MSIAVALGACSGSKRTAAQDSSDPAGGEPTTRRIIGYFTAWSVYDRDYHVADIPADKLTHVNYGFASISATGECELGDAHADVENEYLSEQWEPGSFHGSFNQLVQLKKRAPWLRTAISVGGWDSSGRFSDVALTPETRQRFASSCVAFVQRYGFDGIDIDWEFPVGGGMETNTTRPQDKQNLTLLLAELRAQLDALGAGNGRRYELTIAAPASPGLYANFELAAIGELVNWINLMTYDFHGDWSDSTNFNAALHASSTDPTVDEGVRARSNTHAVVQAYLAAGVPAGKIVVGVPFYGRGYQGVPGIDNGLYQPYEGEAMGTWDPGIFDYYDIVQSYLPTYQRFWHDEAMVPWLYDPVTGIMISYDDPESLSAKAAYINEHGLGGAMVWELSNDTPDAALLSTLHERLRL